MTYIHSINPFSNVICAPFYHIWLLIIISWILALIEIIYTKYIYNCYETLSKQLSDSKYTSLLLSNKIRDQYKIELLNISIHGHILPNRVIEIILDLLPQQIQNIHTFKIYKNYIQSIQLKMCIMKVFVIVYQSIRFIANFINLIIILVYYATWYKNNEYLSNWDKYCAFIISFFYMPNMKGRSVMRFFNHDLYMSISYEIGGTMNMTFWIPIFIVTIFAIWFTIISFPIFVTGIFIYIPNTILGLIIGFGLTSLFTTLGEKYKYDYYKDNVAGTIIVVTTTFLGMWYWIIIILPTMELFHGNNWTSAYRIGFLGEYCDENDYFQFNKWDKYTMDIKF